MNSFQIAFYLNHLNQSTGYAILPYEEIEDYEIEVPQAGWYREILNSDSRHYGGSNVGNYPGVTTSTDGVPAGRFVIRVTLPPLAMVVFKRAARTATDSQRAGVESQSI